MPSNLYGVANPLPSFSPFGTIGAANVGCPAGVETNVIASVPLIQVSGGWFYPLVSVYITLGLTASPPTAITVACRLGAGSDLDAATVNPGLLVPSATLALSFPLSGPASNSAYVSPGSILNVTVFPIAQAVTCGAGGTRIVVQLLRAPDQ